MKLSKFLYFGDFVACPLAILALLIPVLMTGDLHMLGSWVLSFLVGGAVWTLVEYVVHRWIYHAVPYFDKMHDAHHKEPLSLIGAPSFASIVVIFVVFYAPLYYYAGWVIAGGFTSGILLGYMLYELVHHAVHHWAPKHGTLMYRLRLAHMAHHYRDIEGNYGVVTSFWDHVFATYVEPQRRRAS